MFCGSLISSKYETKQLTIHVQPCKSTNMASHSWLSGKGLRVMFCHGPRKEFTQVFQVPVLFMDDVQTYFISLPTREQSIATKLLRVPDLLENAYIHTCIYCHSGNSVQTFRVPDVDDVHMNNSVSQIILICTTEIISYGPRCLGWRSDLYNIEDGQPIGNPLNFLLIYTWGFLDDKETYM